MAATPYRHEPQTEFLSAEQAERVHETALRILHEVGLEVDLPSAREQLAARGFRLAGKRVILEPRAVQAFVEEYRRRQAEQAPAPQPPPDDGVLRLSVGVYAHHMHDLASGRIVPYTTAALVEMTKLVDVLTERGLADPAPGYPLDMAPPLQPVMQYWVQANYSRHGAPPVDPISDASVPYIMEMAEVMGHPLRALPVYVFSPLRLAGESLRAALHRRDRLEALYVGAMPSLGGSAPVLPYGALAVAAAEMLGAGVVLAALTGLPVELSTGLHALNLHSGSMIFGSPETFLLGQLSDELRDYYAGSHHRPGDSHRPPAEASIGIHSRANFPNAQAAAERGMLLAAGALAGVRRFHGAGILAVDEVFSAEQLLVDLEIRDSVQRLLRGLNMSDEGYDWVAEARRGVAEGGFMGAPSTVAHHREMYWYPRLFERGFFAAQGPDGLLELPERARDMARDCIARHEFELHPAKRRALERVVARAQREL